jgi:hypothetical protein
VVAATKRQPERALRGAERPCFARNEIGIMSFVTFRPSRWLVTLWAGFLSFGALAVSVQAVEPATPVAAFAGTREHDAKAVYPHSGEGGYTPKFGQTAPVTLFGGLFDGVLGNRSRMVQYAFIGFAIGVAILVTATRKH